MWKSERSRQPFAPDSPVDGMDHTESAETRITDRVGSTRNGNMLDELRGQPGFGVVVTAGHLHPTAPQAPSIGQRMSAELDALSRRERQVREMNELANSRVIDLTTEQLRRILEFMI